MMLRRVIGCGNVAGILKSRYSFTSRSRSSFFCSTSCITDVQVNSLEIEPGRKSVASAVTGVRLSTSENPYPLANRTWPSLTTTITAPPMSSRCSCSGITPLRNASTSAAVIAGDWAPANDKNDKPKKMPLQTKASRRPICLEPEFQRELHDPGIYAGRQNVSERGRSLRRTGIGEVHPIKDVEELRAELQAGMFSRPSHRKVLDEREVDVLLSRPALGSHADVSKRRPFVVAPDHRIRADAALVEIAVEIVFDIAGRQQLRVRASRGDLPAVAGDPENIVGVGSRDRQAVAGLERRHGAHLPSAERFAQQGFARRAGQRIDTADNETLIANEAVRTIALLRTILISRRRSAVGAGRRTEIGGKQSRERIGRLQLQTVTELLVEVGIQRVVPTRAGVLDIGESARRESLIRHARLDVGDGIGGDAANRIGGAGQDRLVDRPRLQKMRVASAHIRNIEHQIAHQFRLHAQAVMLERRRTIVLIDDRQRFQ